MTRFLKTWLASAVTSTLVMGIVMSWQSQALTLQLDVGIFIGLVVALACSVFEND